MKNILISFSILILLGWQIALGAQDQKSNIFENGDRACFVGDSITAGGWCTANIMLYYATRFPEMKLDFRNIGISGDGCGGILWRMNWDIMPQLDKNKSVSVLMIGMNDVGRTKFGKNARAKFTEKAFNAKIDSTRKNYTDNLSKIVDNLSENSRKFIIFTPSIYDQTATLKEENLFGVNDELVVYGEIGKTLAAKKENAAAVDMSKAMLAANAKLQNESGSDKTIIGPDRVHPRFGGGLIMLDKWLSDLNEPSYVADIEIDANSGKLEKSFNCDISNLKISKDSAAFDYLAAALPFPVEKTSRDFLKLVDFQKNYNKEILKIKSLPDGKYNLKIDDKKVGEYTARELSQGINLAANDSAPQYKQAEEVSRKCLKFRGDAANYRSLFMLELFNRKVMDNMNVDQKIAFIQKKLDDNPNERNFMISAYKFYIANKKNQLSLFEKLSKLNDEIYTVAKPKTHSFEISPLK